MNSLDNLSCIPLPESHNALGNSSTATDLHPVLVREAGVPFCPPSGKNDPFGEWLGLMEVVQMLCPDWPVRDKPLLGKQWRL